MINKKNAGIGKDVIRVSLLAFSLSLLAWPLAAAQKPAPSAKIEATSNLFTFEPVIAYDQVRVTVSGPGGFEVVKTFGVGETPSVDLPGVDGFYKYELRFSPALSDEEREALRAARETGTEIAEVKTSSKRMVQAGSFSLAGGSVVPDLREPEPDKVVLTNGDGVIRNSLCVGFDCPNAPIFSDSTILLMENNTRIKFGDTSNAPFPNNDWEIEANSSLSGGANYLGFNDCGTADNDGGCATDLVFAVESGARQNALYVESDGDVGLGTSNPVVDIHLVIGNTPTLRLDQDGSSGFAPQVWDVAGNETNFFVRDVTGGSLLPFRIRPDAPTSSIDIAASGDVGIGTASPGSALHVVRSSSATNAGLELEITGASAQSWIVKTQTSNGQLQVRDETASTIPWRVGPGANSNLFLVGMADATTNDPDRVSITGEFFINGVNNSNPDYVFEPDYELESIEEHARYMWENKHLPAVGAGVSDGDGKAVIDVAGRSQAVLEELEKAHIYIEQLHAAVQDLQAEVDALKALAKEPREETSIE